MSDVDVVIGADASKLNRELRAAQDELDRLTRAQQRAGAAAGQLDGAVDGARKRLDAAAAAAHRAGVSLDRAQGPVVDMDRGMASLAKGAALTGSAFGSMAGPLGDVGDAFAMMPPQAAAATVALAATVGVVYQLGSNAIETARNADKLSDSLGDGKTQALQAKAALEGLDKAQSDAAISMGLIFVPAVEDGADAMSGLVVTVDGVVNALAGGAGGGGFVGAWLTAVRTMASSVPGLREAVSSWEWAYEKLRGIGAAAREIQETMSTDPANMTADEAGRVKARADLMQQIEQDALNNRLDQIEKERDARKRAAEEAARDAKQRAEAAQRIADQEAAERQRRDDAVAEHRIRLNVDNAKAQAESMRVMGANVEAFQATEAKALAESREAWAAYQYDIANAAVETMSATERMQQDIGQVGNAVGQFANYAVNLTNSVVSLVEQIQTNSGNRSREALRKQFAARKAAAIAEATVNTALAATQALSTPPIAVGIVLMALAIAAGGVQIANIAAQKPSFHRGGSYRSGDMAPDERDVSVRARANEAMFMTNQAIGAWASQLARLNTGQAPAQGASVVVMMDGPRQTRGFARPDPGYGHAMIGGA